MREFCISEKELFDIIFFFFFFQAFLETQYWASREPSVDSKEFLDHTHEPQCSKLKNQHKEAKRTPCNTKTTP
jgi:hypothetical protein